MAWNIHISMTIVLISTDQSEWVSAFNSPPRMVDIEMHVIHINLVIITYTLEPLPSLDNPQYTGYDLLNQMINLIKN